jgi:hypothetical protein
LASQGRNQPLRNVRLLGDQCEEGSQDKDGDRERHCDRRTRLASRQSRKKPKDAVQPGLPNEFDRQPANWVQLICELQRDWLREATVPGFAEIIVRRCFFALTNQCFSGRPLCAVGCSEITAGIRHLPSQLTSRSKGIGQCLGSVLPKGHR